MVYLRTVTIVCTNNLL